MISLVKIFLISTVVCVPVICARHESNEFYYDYDGAYEDEDGNYEWEDEWDHQNHKPLPFYRACGTRTDENNTILYNPSYPQTYGGGSRCSYRIYRESRKICQIRVDFLAFSLAPPTGDGLCATDYFSIEGGSTTVPRICGENAGQHLYVGVSGRLPIVIVVATTGNVAIKRRWHIRVSQIRCRSPYRAPVGCLQYHLEPSGFIRSFNYAMEESANPNSIGVKGSRQIANLDYNICIRSQLGKCSITYKRPVSDFYAFTLTNDVTSVELSVLGTPVLQSQSCSTDYIVVQTPSQVIRGIRVPLAGNTFCGLGIGDIYSRIQPFSVRVVTDSNETPDIANRGFYLNYSQDICI